MQNQFSRTQLLVGKPVIETLMGARVAVFGIGGVGGYVVEFIARSGIGVLNVCSFYTRLNPSGKQAILCLKIST